uniref:Uncharacterized protein n=1 Tax=Myotis lucifugus TaxID=59463 RepID=G1Q3F5_MYOLU
QIQKVAMALGHCMRASCLGGTSVHAEVQKLQMGAPHIIVGASGHVFDMLTYYLSPKHIKRFVWMTLMKCEAMFRDHIYDIFQKLTSNSRVICSFGAMTPQVLEVTQTLLRDPIRVLGGKEELTLEGICQFYINAEGGEWKLDVLCALDETLPITQVVISRTLAERLLTEQMHARDFAVSALHGDANQRSDVTRREFHLGSSGVLTHTDLARGRDVPQVSLATNCDLPPNKCHFLKG